MFNLKKFRRPDAIHTPAYFWMLNSSLDEKTLREQIRDMAKKGAKSLCPHPFPMNFRDFFMSKMTPDYLTDEYFESYKIIADECEKQGICCYLYDEGGWPSGMACGKVWESDPEKFSRYNVVEDENAPDGVKIVPSQDIPGQSKRADILAPGAVEKFLELTHEQYKKHIGSYFGKTFKSTFTDEPEMSRSWYGKLFWTADFREVFQARKGYDIYPHLRRLVKHGDGAEDIQHRIDFCDVASQLFVERYLLPIRSWCRANGILSGGHMGGEEELENMAFASYGHIMRALRYLDMPGVDLIWRQIWHGVRLHSFPKFASSVANQGGHQLISGEVFGVYGAGLTFDQMRFLVDYFVLCGVNAFILCTNPLDTSDGLQLGERPLFGPVNPQWQHIKPFHDYVGRVSMLNAQGRPEVDTAFFFDAHSLWSAVDARYADNQREKIAAMLMERQIDFDYIDDDTLAEAKIRKGRIVIGKASYKQLVVPVNARFAAPAAKRLAQLRAAGFPVLTQDEISDIAPTLTTGDWRLRVRKRRLRGGDVIYFIFNSSGKKVTATLEAVEKAAVAHLDCESGNVYRAGENGKWSFEFHPYRCAAFLVGAGAESAGAAPAAPGEVIAEISGKWRIRPEVKHFVGENNYVREKCRVRSKAVKLGSWAEALGKDYCGSAVYSVDFESDGSAGFLDLGEVKYSAMVKLNGKNLGIRTYAPYVYDISGAVKPGSNKLEVQIVNTLASAILADGVQEKWAKLPFAGPYEGRHLRFERESLDSGLYGPVTLKKAK